MPADDKEEFYGLGWAESSALVGGSVERRTAAIGVLTRDLSGPGTPVRSGPADPSRPLVVSRSNLVVVSPSLSP